MNQKLICLREAMKTRSLDAVIINDEKNIGYLCDYFYTDGYLFIGDSFAYIITDSRYDAEASLLASSEFTVTVPKKQI